MVQRPSPDVSCTPEQLEEDANRVAACLESVRGVIQAMKDRQIPSIRLVRGASFSRCYEAAKAWSRTVIDGIDEAVEAGRFSGEMSGAVTGLANGRAKKNKE